MAMTRDEYLWKQVEQVHEYLRFVGGQAMSWFAFGIGVNTAAAWAILNDGSALQTNVGPYIFLCANCLAAGACFFALPAFYVQTSRTLALLTSQLSIFKDDATQSVSLSPAFKLWLWLALCILVGGLFVVIAGGWQFGICKHYFISRS